MARRYRPLPAGERRHRIRIEKLTVTRDAIGGASEVWTLVARRWSTFTPLPGRELMEGEQLVGKSLSQMIFPHVAGMTPKYRITKDNGARTLNIRDVTNPEERNIETHVIVEEIV